MPVRFFATLSDLWKFSDPDEERYARHVLVNDLTGFRLFTGSALVISALFLIVDMTRPVDFRWMFAMRSSINVFYASLLVISYHRKLSPGALQGMLVIQIVVSYIIYFVQSSVAQMPFFFLTNILLLLFYTGISVSGLRFRHGLIVNTGAFLVFIIITEMKDDTFYQSQVPNLLLNLIVSLITGGFIENQKRKNFRQFTELDLLNQQKAE